MNNDLISRKAVIEVIDAVFPVDPMKSEYAQGIACGAALAKTYIEQLPPAQPERKKGKWVEVDDFYNRISGRCSVCGWEAHMYEDDVVGMNFCPNCGSYNGGEQDE